MKYILKYKIYLMTDDPEGVLFGDNIKEFVLDGHFDFKWPEGFDSFEEAVEVLAQHGNPGREYTILPSVKIPF